MKPAVRPPARADQTTVRRANLGVVLGHVVDRGPCTRARVAAETGLTRGTVSSLVAELIELGLLREGEEAAPTGGVGRPGLQLELADEIGALGLEVNVDYLAVSVADLTGAVRNERRVYQDNRASTPGPVLDRLAELAVEVLDDADTAGVRVAGAAVALPGLVEVASGTLLRAPNLGWSELPASEELSERLDGLEVAVENEANLAALAEHRHGAARGLESFVCVFGEVGVGAGIFVDGRLFRGSHGYGGELGHVTVAPGGEPCACGSRGCLETIVGQEAIARRAGISVARGERARSLTVELVRRASEGNVATVQAIRESGRVLGTALASTLNLFDLDGVVLAGAFGPLAPWLEDEVRTAIDEHVLSTQWLPAELRASTLGEGAAVVGAATLVLTRVLAAPWRVADLDRPRRAVLA